LDRIGAADFGRAPRLAQIEWSFPATGLQSGGIDPEGGRMILSGGPSSSGVAASRVVALEPGRYRLSLQRAEPEVGNKATVRVAIACVERTPHVQLARFREEGGRVEGSFEVRPGCRYHSVQVQLDVPRDSVSGLVTIAGIQLQPA